MKADGKPSIEEVASMLCKNATVPDWVMEKLRNRAPLVGHHSKHDDDDVERKLFQSALHLQNWLPMYARAAKMLGEECPPIIDDVMNELDELIPFLAQDIQPPRSGGPRPDLRRCVCAEVCAEIWEKLHNVHQPHSERLWEACEAYWQACGHPETSAVGRLRNWERYLLELSPP